MIDDIFPSNEEIDLSHYQVECPCRFIEDGEIEGCHECPFVKEGEEENVND